MIGSPHTGGECPSCPADGYAVVGVEIPGVYDGILYWGCLQCGHAWQRWPVEHYLHKRAAPYIERARSDRPDLRGKTDGS